MCTLLQRQDEIGREENRLRCLSHQTRNKDYSSSGPLPPPSFSVLPPYSVLNASIKRTTDRLSHKISKKKKKKKKKLFFSFPRPIGHVTLRRSTLRKKKIKKFPNPDPSYRVPYFPAPFPKRADTAWFLPRARGTLIYWPCGVELTGCRRTHELSSVQVHVNHMGDYFLPQTGPVLW